MPGSRLELPEMIKALSVGRGAHMLGTNHRSSSGSIQKPNTDKYERKTSLTIEGSVLAQHVKYEQPNFEVVLRSPDELL
jgi:hypothetical protein